MYNYLILLCIYLTPAFSAISQDSKLDTGFGGIRIDEKLTKLKPYLTKLEVADWLPSMQEMEGYVVSGWTFDFNKAGLNEFYSLKIRKIEIYFDSGEEESEEDDNVFSFQIYLEPAEDGKTEDKFINALFAEYGDAMPLLNMDSEEVVGFFWFTSITLLNVNLGVDVESGEEYDYYLADFNQGYGG